MEGDELTEYALRRGDGTMDIRSPGGTERLLRASGARRHKDEASKTGSDGLHGESPEQAAELAASLGLECLYYPRGRERGWWCEGEKLPGYIERARRRRNAS
jgi:hypothetical protein